MSEKTFALELLEDYKRQNKIKNIIILVLLGIITLFVGGLMYFIINYEIEFEDVIIDGDSNNYNNEIVGDVYNGD